MFYRFKHMPPHAYTGDSKQDFSFNSPVQGKTLSHSSDNQNCLMMGLFICPSAMKCLTPNYLKGGDAGCCPHGKETKGRCLPVISQALRPPTSTKSIDAVLVSFQHLDTNEGHLGRGNIIRLIHG